MKERKNYDDWFLLHNMQLICIYKSMYVPKNENKNEESKKQP